MEDISWFLNSGRATDLEFARRPEESCQIPQSSSLVSQPRFEMAPPKYVSSATVWANFLVWFNKGKDITHVSCIEFRKNEHASTSGVENRSESPATR